MNLQRFLTTSGFAEGAKTVESPVPPSVATVSAEFTSSDADKFSHATDASLSLAATDFTIAGWFKPTAASITRYMMTYGSSEAAADSSWYINTPGLDRVRINISDGTSITQVNSNLITLGTSWHFFAITFDNTSKELTCSLDNGTAGSTTATGVTIPNAGTAFQMGFASGFSSPESDFKACSIGMWSRVLTGTEITSLYNSGTAAKLWDGLTSGEQTGAIAYWNLEESSGNRADDSGNGYTLTDTNTVPSSADAP